MSNRPDQDGTELRRLHSEVDARELGDLRAIRDALTQAELPHRRGLELAAASIGHGVTAGRRAAFVRTAFAATAPYSDDPSRVLSWANTALVARAGTSSEFVTAACVTYLPEEKLLRWSCVGHPPALTIHDGRELVAPHQGDPLGFGEEPEYVAGTLRTEASTGLLLYTDGLTEARHGGRSFGLEGVRFAEGSLIDDLCMLAARIA